MKLIAVIIAVLTATACTAVAENATGAFMMPQGAVRKVGDSVEFECRSPYGYTTLKYRKIEFVWEHGEQRPVVNVEDVVANEDYTKIKFDVVVSKKNAGKYKCYIHPVGGNKNVNVTVTAELYVVEAENKTEFMKKDSSYKLVCLENDNLGNLGFKPELSWYIEGIEISSKYANNEPYSLDDSDNKSLLIKNAEKEDAFKDIRCAVTSPEAFKTFGSVTVPLGNQSAAEIQKTVSVIEISKCKKIPCQLEVKVYGHTPVTISWMIDSHFVNATHERKDNVTLSRTEVLSSTDPVLLTITGGQNTWSESIKPGSPDDVSNGLRVVEIIGIVLGGLAAAAAAVIFIVCYCKRKNLCCFNKTQSTASGPEEQPLKNFSPTKDSP